MNYASADGKFCLLRSKIRSWKLFTSSDKDEGKIKLHYILNMSQMAIRIL